MEKKAVLLTFVSMYFAELLCLHFLVFTCCRDVKKKHNVMGGKGQGLLQIIIERKKEKKMQRNVRRS